MTNRNTWRMEHPDNCEVVFVRNSSGTITRTIYGPIGCHITDHCETSPITRPADDMRCEWDRLVKKGFVPQ